MILGREWKLVLETLQTHTGEMPTRGQSPEADTSFKGWAEQCRLSRQEQSGVGSALSVQSVRSEDGKSIKSLSVVLLLSDALASRRGGRTSAIEGWRGRRCLRRVAVVGSPARARRCQPAARTRRLASSRVTLTSITGTTCAYHVSCLLMYLY